MKTFIAVVCFAFVICGPSAAQDVEYVGSALWNGIQDVNLAGSYAY
jgi:hypothetical protein